MSYLKADETKPVPRIFVKLTKLSDSDCNTIVTSGDIAVTGWTQLRTLGGARFTQSRDTSDLENDQDGVVNVVVDKEGAELSIVLSSQGLSDLIEINKINLASTGANSGIGIKENRGYSLKNVGLSFFIYDKNLDPSNETDTPNVTCDANSWCIFNAVPISGVTKKWDGSQNTMEVTFRPLASSSSGSARGYKGWIGAFSQA